MIITRSFRFVRNLLRDTFRLYNRVRLKNKNFSVISRDCVGGVIVHDLRLRFDSPTVNLYFSDDDFLKFCRNIKFYISQELIETAIKDITFPVGTLGQGEDKIVIYFVHYDSFAQAKQKWDERCKRIHWDNLYFITNDRGNSSEDFIRKFDALPYEHKAIITFRDFDGVKSAVRLPDKYIHYLTKENEWHTVLEYISRFSLGKIIDEWDYVNFFNS